KFAKPPLLALHMVTSPSPPISKARCLHWFSLAKVVLIAQVALFLLALAGCATQPVGTERHVKGTPQPNRWKEFLERAERGELEEVRDEPVEPSTTVHWIDYQFGPVGTAAHPGAATGSEVFKGKFRPE